MIVACAAQFTRCVRVVDRWVMREHSMRKSIRRLYPKECSGLPVNYRVLGDGLAVQRLLRSDRPIYRCAASQCAVSPHSCTVSTRNGSLHLTQVPFYC